MLSAALTIDELAAHYLPGTAAMPITAVNDNQSKGHSTPDAAPSVELLRFAVAAVKNGDHYIRADCVRMAHIIHGATAGTAFANQGREIFLTWAADYPGSDPDADEAIWRTTANTYIGYRHLKEWVEVVDASAYRELRRREFAVLDGQGGDGEAAGPGKGKQSLQQRMIELIEHRLRPAGWVPFKATDGRYFLSCGPRVFSLSSEADIDEICGMLLRDFKQHMSGTSRNVLKDLLVQQAAGGPVYKVHCRAGTSEDGVLYLDLANDADQVVEITAAGWRIIDRSAADIKLERRVGMLPLPRPVAGSLKFLDLIQRCINIPAIKNANDPRDAGVQARAALVCAATAWLRRRGTLPLLLLAGAMGSGKTRAATRIKQLIDPDVSPSMQSLGNEGKDILLMARSQLLLVLDNASSIKAEHSDLFCTLLDGTGYAGRALYTNADRFVMTAHSGLATTSIRDDLIVREDLLDRTVRVEIEPLAGARRPVEDLDAEWAAELPALLGSLLDLMVAGLAGLHSAKASTATGSLPRLVDAALFAEAALRSQGWRDGLCIEALMAARESSAQDNLSQNPVAPGIAAVVAEKDFEGTMEQLRDKVHALGFFNETTNNPTRFSAAVIRTAPLLSHWGITFTRHPRTATARLFSLSKPRGDGPMTG